MKEIVCVAGGYQEAVLQQGSMASVVYEESQLLVSMHLDESLPQPGPYFLQNGGSDTNPPGSTWDESSIQRIEFN